MRTTILALSLVCAQAHALGPYKYRPAQMFGGGASVATINVGQTSSCAVWTCGTDPQLAVVRTSALTDAMRADWAALLVTGNGSPLNSMRDKYARDDVCTTLWDAWAACRVGLTVQQLTALWPAR
jgi:hypothetical protein